MVYTIKEVFDILFEFKLYVLSDGFTEFFLPHLSYPNCLVDCVCRYRLRSTAQWIRETVVHSCH